MERMKRFGLDVKNKDQGSTRNVELNSDKSASELEKLKAARLARFGEVDPADLKRKLKQGGKKRDLKQKSKQGGKKFK